MASGAAEAGTEVVDAVAAQEATPQVAQLQELLADRDLGAYIVPTADAHNSEYVSARDMRRVFISGFTGSAGTAVILAEPDAAGYSAYLWADSRYWVQAAAELPTGWGLVKQGSGDDSDRSIEQFLQDSLPAGAKVGVDPLTVTYVLGTQWEKALAESEIALSPVEENLVDAVWGEAQPPPPDGEIAVQPLEAAGAATAEKLATVREALGEAGANATVVTALDEIMYPQPPDPLPDLPALPVGRRKSSLNDAAVLRWLFNIRGNPADIDFNPVIMSYAVLTAEPPTATLWVSPDKMDDAALAHLSELAELRPYDGAVPDIAECVKGAVGAAGEGGIKVLLDRVSCNLAIHTLLSVRSHPCPLPPSTDRSQERT